ncbi:uncharacterized protein LOC123694618 [Colias croceus]|uniref:uncharacterized protein LOC123694618 n=1 Tax=Colias crocea TaxID=72248 RepID=UPI001E27B0A2|nr:uncharacterized protein LOC123694618 [Colias croceus]
MRRFGEQIEDRGKYILQYKGETPGLYGVGFMIKKNLANNIIELRGISERISILNIKLNDEKWSIIQAYSPTESDKKEDLIKTDKFYEELQNTIETSHKNVLLMGDFNGQIGTQNRGEEYSIGDFGFGTRSKNGTRLVNFSLQNKLSVLNSFYKKKLTKKWTWISPNGLHKNEIDFIMSNNRKAFKDLSIIQNLNFNTDHRMVRATMAGTYPKKTRQFHNKYAVVQYTGDTELLLKNLKTSLQTKEHLPIEEKYNKLLHKLKTVTKKTNTNTKKEISSESKALLQKRKELLHDRKTKENRKKISELSKLINEKLRKERKTKRTNTMKNFIEKTGGIKKAIKELNCKKEWITSMKKKDGFVDFNKAFDTLEHEFIWMALKTQGVQPKYLRILQNVYTKSTAQVKLETIGQEFPIRRGVRQGDPISPKLFSAVLETIFRKLDWKNLGLNINGEYLSHLRFADDIIIFSESPKTLQSMLQQLADESAKAGLTMNLMKTKIMSNSTQNDTITLDGVGIEYVHEYVYLGQLISTEDCMKEEIERRIANTWKRYWSLSEVMKNKDMPMKEKRKVFNMCILPCLLYGCQTWALTEQLANKIKVCQNGIERSTIGVKRKDREKLKDIKSKTKFKNAYITYKQLKWKWTGHMIREKKEKWTRQITEWYPIDCKRNRGRQITRWEDGIRKIAGPTWTRKARDRTEWRSLEEAFVGRQVEE